MQPDGFVNLGSFVSEFLTHLDQCLGWIDEIPFKSTSYRTGPTLASYLAQPVSANPKEPT